jgi:hypothetical protein
VKTQKEDVVEPNIITVYELRRMNWEKHLARMGAMRNTYKISIGKFEYKPPVRRPRRRWEDNIRKDLREIGCEDLDFIHLAQDRE